MQDKRARTFDWQSITFSSEDAPITTEWIQRLLEEARKMLDDPSSDLPPVERIEKLCLWAERWRNPRSPWRLKAEHMLPESTRLSRPMLNACLNLFFRSFRREALEALVQRFPDESKQLVGHILPANVLAASAESFLAETVLGHVNIV